MLCFPSSFALEHCPEPRDDLNALVSLPALQQTFKVKACWTGTRSNSAFAFLSGWREVVAAGGFEVGQHLRLTVLPDGTFSVERGTAEAVKNAQRGGGKSQACRSPRQARSRSITGM